MSTVSRTAFVGLVSLACALSAGTTGALADDVATVLDSMRQKYDEKLAAIESEYRTKNDTLPGQYVSSLGALERTTQEKGDLTGLLLIKAEQKRFSESNTIDPGDVTSESDSLRDLQIKYLVFVSEREIEKNEKLVALTEQYVKSLAEMEKDLTKKGQIDEAMKTRNAREQVLASPALSRAEFDLADAKDRRAVAETLRQKQTQGESSKQPERPASEPDRPPEAPADNWGKNVGGRNVQIYPEGKEPLGTAGKFKRLAVATTDRGTTLQSVSLDVSVGKDFLYKREKSGDDGWPSIYGWHPRRFVDKQTRYNLRFVVGSKVAGEEVRKPTLLVEYFVKPEVRTKEEFQRCTNEIIRLPNLVAGSKYVIDTSGITVEDGQYAGGRNYSVDFYGVIVSIFDGKKNLVYQTTSSPALKDIASPAPPDSRINAPPADDGSASSGRFRPLGKPLNKDRRQ